MAGAVNTDARHAFLIDVAGDQHNTFVNYHDPLQTEKILARLQPVERGGHYHPPCMEGTRKDIFKGIGQWLDDIDAPNVLWLRGSPGAGKSTLASSLISTLSSQRRLGSSFCFRREDVPLSDPAVLWRTVAYDLAKFDLAFSTNLIQILKTGVVDPSRPDIASHFQYLIQEPLMKTYDDSSPSTIPVIVFDALDECGSDRSQTTQRGILLNTLTKWSHFPKTFKLIVTSRDERVPESFRAICFQIALPTGRDVSADANNDIRYFFEKRFGELGWTSMEWPGSKTLDELTARAAGLFQWAETVVKFLDQGIPVDQLEYVLSGDLGQGDNITKLYRQILEISFREASGRTHEVFRRVVALVVLAKVPLHFDDLPQFLLERKTSVRFILDKLSSVISFGSTDKRLTICHLSFSEFLCDRKRCPEQFFIDKGKESQELVAMCFRLMKNELKFNICNMETSHLANDQVDVLPARIEKNLRNPLLYSCKFWAAHLQDMTQGQDGHRAILTEVKDFLHARFLFWLEVMSLTKEVPAATVALSTAIPWIEVSSCLTVTFTVANIDSQMFDPTLSAFARDARQFVLTFNTPISASAPHIYLSALPFSPPQSLVAKRYRSQFPNTLAVVSGLNQSWPGVVNIFQGHSKEVNSVAFSPDGKRIASGSSDTTIRIWDVETGRMVTSPFEGHTSEVYSVAFSPDGNCVASGSWDKTIRIWDAETGQIIAGPFEGHTGHIYSVAFSSDGKQVASGALDNTIRIWDVKTGQISAGPLEGHKSGVYSVAFSPNGNRIVSGSGDNKIRIWDTKTGQTITEPFKDHTEPIYSVAFTADGRRVVSGSWDKRVCIWDAETGQIIAGPIKGHVGPVHCVAISQDGKQVASGSWDKTVRIWDAETGQLTAGPFEGHMNIVASVAFSPDGKRVVSGSWDRTIRMWDVKTGVVVTESFKGHTMPVNSIAFSPDGKRLASGAWDKTVRIWDAATGQLVTSPFQGHTESVYSVAFSPDGKWVASGSWDKTIHIWDAETRQIVAGPFKGHTHYIYSVAFSSDGMRVVSGSWDNSIRIWDVESGQMVSSPFEGHKVSVNSVAFSPSGKRVVSGSGDKTIRIWDVETGQMVASPFEGHTDYVYSVAFSPDGKRVVSGSWDKTIRIWDAETGQIIAGPFEGHTDHIYSVAFSPDGKRVVSGSEDKTVRIWDAETGENTIGPFEGHTESVNAVAFSPNGKQVASGSWDNTIRIWDATPNLSSHMRTHLAVLISAGGGLALSSHLVVQQFKSGSSDGWVASASDDHLLFWVPPPYRGRVCGIESLVICGKHATRLDFSRFVHGSNWTQCYSPCTQSSPPIHNEEPCSQTKQRDQVPKRQLESEGNPQRATAALEPPGQL